MMYSRSYETKEDSLCVPDGYGGTALSGDIHTDNEEVHDKECAAGAVPRAGGGLFSRIMPSLSSWLPFDGNKLLESFKIGKEEIIIIATALFLLFSEDGDRECAILLLLLLFIN